MENSIKYLVDITTIVKAIDNNDKIIFGNEQDVSMFQRDPGTQCNLTELEEGWNNKWGSFRDIWNDNRQMYRFLYDSFRLFYYSFEQLRKNKVNSIEESNNDMLLYYNNITGVNLCGVYHHGKKCIDLIKKLDLIPKKDGIINFCSNFSETRNKLIEHNSNPAGFEFLIEPIIWSLVSSASLMEIRIHNKKEHVYSVYIDYYSDYFNLENILTDIINKFK